jgi:predicted TIM-barrel fold metal-dependent hydrolase
LRRLSRPSDSSSPSPEATGRDLDALVTIDVHVHVEPDVHGHLSMDDELLEAAAAYCKGEPHHPAVPQIATHHRSLDMAAVLFTVDSELATGHPKLSKEEIADAAHPDVLIPFGSIDPARGQAGIRAARRLVEEHGVRGFLEVVILCGPRAG